MKSFLCTLLFSIFVLAGYAGTLIPDSVKIVDIETHPTFDKENCTCKGIPLYGKVEVVNIGADFKVEVVDISPDLKVEKVDISPNKCGKWEFVTTGADFKVEFVSISGDFKIEYVTISPGIY